MMFGLLADQPYYSLMVKPFIAMAAVRFVDNIMLSLRIASRVPFVLWGLRRSVGELNENTLILKLTEQVACGRWEPKVCETYLPFNGL